MWTTSERSTSTKKTDSQAHSQCQSAMKVIISNPRCLGRVRSGRSVIKHLFKLGGSL